MTPEEAMHETIDALRASADTIAALRGELATLRQQLAAVEQRNATQALTIQQKREAWYAAHTRAKEAEAALADLRVQLADEKKDARGWFDANLRQRQQLAAQGETIRALQGERDTLVQQVATLTQERDWLRADVTKIDNEREDAVDALEAMRAERDALVQQLHIIRELAESQREHTDDAVATRFAEIASLATLTPPPAQPPQESATCPLCGRMRAWILARGYVCCYMDCAAHPAVTPPPAGETERS